MLKHQIITVWKWRSFTYTCSFTSRKKSFSAAKFGRSCGLWPQHCSISW